MYCFKCGNKLRNNCKFCSNCGLEQINNNNKLNRVWFGCAIGLIVLAFVVLFSGIVMGIGDGYENPNSRFDFSPFGITFVIINAINIIFNITMLVIKKNKKSNI